MNSRSTLDMNAVMETLAQSRPVFHSESDFKHALSWQIQRGQPAIRIRQEVGNLLPGPDRRYVDIWLPDSRTAIELKYRTTPATICLNDEEFDLKGQGATLIGRYDFWHDVVRQESAVFSGRATQGYAHLLTNDPLYWDPGRPGTFDQQFRVHEGKEVSGTLAWGRGTGAGTTKGQYTPTPGNGKHKVQIPAGACEAVSF